MQMHFARACLPALLLALASCGEVPSSSAAGSLGEGVQVSPTGTVTLANYTISGPNGFASAGTVPVGDSLDVPVTVSHLPVGQGYELYVSATASDGVTVCMGNSPFDVTDATATITVTVALTCGVPTGDVNVQATLNVCPVVDDLTAAPLVVNLGGVSSMSVVAHDSDNGPAPLTYAWSANGLLIAHQTAPALSFACSSRGDVTVAAIVSDGDANPGCPGTASAKVTCQ
jgi:hypothetical protein